jgi:hypothetical protein
MRYIVGILSIFSVLLYSTGYWICEQFYLDDITEWRKLRDLLSGVVVFLLVILNFLPKNNFSNASLTAFGILCFGNIVDRTIFDITTFVGSDYWLIGTALIVFLIKIGHAKTVRRNLANFHENNNPGTGGR